MDTKYFYVKSPENHCDLADLFGGVYIKEKELWRFNKSQEKEVVNFLYCSSSEDEEDLDEYLNNNSVSNSNSLVKEKNKISTKKDRLHRANSFNASDSSDESDDSLSATYHRSKTSHLSNLAKLEQELQNLKKQ